MLCRVDGGVVSAGETSLKRKMKMKKERKIERGEGDEGLGRITFVENKAPGFEALFFFSSPVP